MPQGAILSPILFLLFINDLPNISDFFKTILFADDTTLSFNHTNPTLAQETLNSELDKFYSWTLSNKLSLNLDKTFFMVHSFTNFNFNDLIIKIQGNSIRHESEGNFLGMTLDSQMKFNTHITQIASKISKSVGVLFKIKDLLSIKTKTQLYYSLIYPYLDYCNIIWGGTATTHLNPLIILQKRAIRIINNKSFRFHTNELFLSTYLLKIEDIHKYKIGTFMYKNNFMAPFTRTHDYFTRNHNLLLPDYQRLTCTQKSITFIGPKVWNEIPDEICNSASLEIFKRLLKKFLIDKYEIE